MSVFYDGVRLLSMKDLDGNKPTFLICTSNRTAGKTTYYNRYFINRFLKYKEKFMLMYRYKTELSDVAEKFFKDIGGLFFSDWIMITKSKAQGAFHTIYLSSKKDPEAEPIECGYAVPINGADALKKYSHEFSDVQRVMFDEFQPEDKGTYCPNEVNKFLSIMTSVSRGQGKQYRFVQCFLIGNSVSILNPYYIRMGITERLRDDTKFLRGHGWVLEQGFNEGASQAMLESGIAKAFPDSAYVAYAAEGVYLNDSKTFIERPAGRTRYIATIRYQDVDYAIRECTDAGLLYCDKSIDASYKFKLAVTTPDHNINYIILKQHDRFISQMRDFFEKGCFRFKDLQCKDAVLKLISYI